MDVSALSRSGETPEGIAAFLAKRYDEAEAAVRDRRCINCGRRTLPLRSPFGVTGYTHDGADDWEGVRCQNRLTGAEPEQQQQRRLADIALKRAILATHRGAHTCPISTIAHHPEKGAWLYTASEHVSGAPYWAPCTTVRHLGTEFADHPDYRQEWRPVNAASATG